MRALSPAAIPACAGSAQPSMNLSHAVAVVLGQLFEHVQGGAGGVDAGEALSGTGAWQGCWGVLEHAGLSTWALRLTHVSPHLLCCALLCCGS
jgi:hypothetical protein